MKRFRRDRVLRVGEGVRVDPEGTFLFLGDTKGINTEFLHP
jgi:hypothetical protein